MAVTLEIYTHEDREAQREALTRSVTRSAETAARHDDAPRTGVRVAAGFEPAAPTLVRSEHLLANGYPYLVLRH
jgi:hypothetical protein